MLSVSFVVEMLGSTVSYVCCPCWSKIAPTLEGFQMAILLRSTSIYYIIIAIPETACEWWSQPGISSHATTPPPHTYPIWCYNAQPINTCKSHIRKFLKPWSSFLADIRDALQILDLNGQVSLLDSCKGEQYLNGNKPGLTAQFIRNLCDLVTEVLVVTSFRGLMLGDIHAVGPSCWEVPDVMLVQLEDPTQPDRGTTTLVTSGEIKTF